MADVILFHHAQGLTPGVVAFADRLRSAGHVVHTPDLYEGRTFPSVEEGVAHASEIGFGEIIELGARAASDLTGRLVYAGMSLGVLPAQMLAQTRPNAVAAILLHSAIPMSEFGEAWPKDVPLQIHAMDADPFYLEDVAAADELVAKAGADLFLYPGDGHLFTDASLAAYDAKATDLVVKRIVTLLAEIG